MLPKYKENHTHKIYNDGSTWMCETCDELWTDECFVQLLKDSDKILSVKGTGVYEQ